MARYFDVNPTNPQPRAIAQVAQILNDDGLIAYPTDSGFAFGVKMGNAAGLDRIRRLRGLGAQHHFTLMVSEFAQLGQYVLMDNPIFRAVKAARPGEYTFILKATKDVPKAMQHPKKRTVGVRITQNRTARALLDQLGAPIMSSTLLLPETPEPLEGWWLADELDHDLDAVLDSGDAGSELTTVVDLSGDEPVILRSGAGDPSPFEL